MSTYHPPFTAGETGYCEVVFEVKAELGHGQAVHVCGSCPSLGNGNHNYGVELTTDPLRYPFWRTSSPVAIPLDQNVTYGYVVFSGGNMLRWENGNMKRKLGSITAKDMPLLMTEGDVLDNLTGPAAAGGATTAAEAAGGEGEEGEEGTSTEALLAAAPGSAAAIATALAAAAGADDTDGEEEKAEKRRSSMQMMMDNWIDGVGNDGGQLGLHPVPLSRTIPSTRRSGSGGGGSLRVKGRPPIRRHPSQKSGEWSEAPAMSPMDGVIVVSFFLPVFVKKDPERQGEWLIEWDFESLLSLHRSTIQLRVTRVGHVRYKGTLTEQDQVSLTNALIPFDCAPVFLDEQLVHKFYSEFCKGILWPTFHHVVDIYGDHLRKTLEPTVLQDLWSAYTQVNRKFKDRVVEVYNMGDIVWVHGFHLLLLPSFLTRVMRAASIGLFLHTPFPSSEIFRTLPFREDLLRGMLNADQVGFHLYEHSRHFLTCCRRILGLMENKGSGRARRGTSTLEYNDREVSIVSIHAGIQPLTAGLDDTADAAGQAASNKDVASLRDAIGGRFVFGGIDKVQRLKGLQLKLAAYRRMLEGHPELAKRCVLVQVGISAHERKEDYKHTSAELRTMTAQVNELGDRGTSEKGALPNAIYLEREESSLTMQARQPWLVLFDALINTGVRDGLNRLPMEYVLAHSNERRQNPGVVLLSEFIPSMRVLRGAMRINPWKVEETADQLRHILDLPKQQREARFAKNSHFVLKNTTATWAYSLLKDLKGVHKSLERTAMAPIGLGLNFRVVGMDASFQPLDLSAVSRAYRHSKHRVLFLDYGGTLLPEPKSAGIMHYALATKAVETPQPPAMLAPLLEQLCSDPRNLVFVVSGREKASIEGYLGGVKGLGIAAEHGLHYRFPGKHHNHVHQGEWEKLVPMIETGWQELTKSIMEIYTLRTHGTYIEEKGSAVLWQYRDADPEFGFLQSKELEDQLSQALKPFSLEILRGGGKESGGYVEVRPEGVDKGAFVERIVNQLIADDRTPSFILAIGDEASDEKMFQAVEAFRSEKEDMAATMGGGGGENAVSTSVFSVTVGKKPSSANSYVDDIDDVMELLRGVAKVSTSVTRNYSTSYLSDMIRSNNSSRDMQNLPDSDQFQLNLNHFNALGASQLAANGIVGGGGWDVGMGVDGGSSVSIPRSASIATFMPTDTPRAAPTMAAYFQEIEEEEDEDAVFF